MADKPELHVDVISPERPLYSGEALSVVAPAHDGKVGILPRHAAMVSKLGVGELRVRRGTLSGVVTDSFAINKGFLQTADNKVIIITEEATQAKDIDKAKVDSDIQELSKKLDGSELKGDERSEAQAKLAWLKAQRAISDS